MPKFRIVSILLLLAVAIVIQWTINSSRPAGAEAQAGVTGKPDRGLSHRVSRSLESLSANRTPRMVTGTFHEVPVESFPESMPGVTVLSGEALAGMEEPAEEELENTANQEPEGLRVLTAEEFAGDPDPDAVESGDSEPAPVVTLDDSGVAR